LRVWRAPRTPAVAVQRTRPPRRLDGMRHGPTPTWASMVARVSAGLSSGKQRRYLTRLLYAPTAGGAALGAVACRPITCRNNTYFPMPGRGYVVAGFSAVAGWGVPDGQKLQHELAQL
jgi:kumamolisin